MFLLFEIAQYLYMSRQPMTLKTLVSRSNDDKFEELSICKENDWERKEIECIQLLLT